MQAVWKHLLTASGGSKIGFILITGDKIWHIITDIEQKFSVSLKRRKLHIAISGYYCNGLLFCFLSLLSFTDCADTRSVKMLCLCMCGYLCCVCVYFILWLWEVDVQSHMGITQAVDVWSTVFRWRDTFKSRLLIFSFCYPSKPPLVFDMSHPFIRQQA